MIVKYNDFAVKQTDGKKFLRGKTGNGTRLTRPGYPEEYRRAIVEQTGDKYLMPKAK